MVTYAIISDIIGAVFWGGLGLSTVLTVFNHLSANSRIKRKGNIIKPITENSVFENIKYFFKDFGFLLVPIYNIIKAIKQTAKKDSEFEAEKTAKLKDRDRLVTPKKPEPAKTAEPVKTAEPAKRVTNPATPTPTMKLHPTRRPAAPATRPAPTYGPATAPATRPATRPVAETPDCFTRKAELEREYAALVDKHTKYKAVGRPVTELNQIVEQIEVLRREYAVVERECTLYSLKSERSSVLDRMDKARTLKIK